MRGPLRKAVPGSAPAEAVAPALPPKPAPTSPVPVPVRLGKWTPPPLPDSSYVPPQRPKGARRAPFSSVASFARFAAGVVTLIAGALIAVGANRLADAGDPWSSWRDALRDDGYTIAVLGVTWLLLGAALQTPLAIRRGARVRAGWLATAALLVHHALVVLIAVPLAAVAADRVVNEYAREPDPGMVYPMMLIAVLLGPSLLALAGGLFQKPDDEGTLGLTVFATMSLAWAVGWVIMSLVLARALDHDVLLIPAEGLPVVALALALAVPSLVSAACARARWTSMFWGSVTPGTFVLAAVAVLLIAALVAQLARVVPGGGLLAIGLPLLPTAYVRLLRFLGGRSATRQAGQSPNS